MLIPGKCHCGNIAIELEWPDEARVDRAPADFEGEETGARLHRRKRNWIGDVNFRSTATPTPRT